MPTSDMQADEPTQTIADFLRLRPWKHALFTTYTLSLSYFESELLRPLSQGGCNDIWLIADAEGYRASLLERRSMQVGQSYRLVPAALPHGVFHAKCIYLSGDHGDLLLVGSGNVTFGGHGRNGEVFEAFTPESAGPAFEEFAAFLEAVGSRPDINIANTNWIEDFTVRSRAAAAGRTARDPLGLRLIHTLERPVIDQLRERYAPSGRCARVRIMSPYHDPDGSSVRQLVDGLGAESAFVAVTDDGESSFPFQQTIAWPRSVSPSRPTLPDERFVHAKWYEFEHEAGVTLLTGSINATRKALTTTDNVELGVLRRLQQGECPLSWKAEAIPTFAPQARMPSGLGGNEIVYASFDRRDVTKLTGKIISLGDTEGLWSGLVIGSDGNSLSFDVPVRHDGAFSVQRHDLESFSDVPALQIVLTISDREARGWVHNEALLSISGRRRLNAGALSRMIQREGLDDDIEALLDYFSQQADRHLRVFATPVVQAQNDDDSSSRSSDLVTVSLAELTPVETDPLSQKPLSDHIGQDDPFATAILRLRRALLGHGRLKGSSPGSSEMSDAEDDPDKAGKKKPKDMAEALGLNEFEAGMDDLIDEAKGNPEALHGLLSMTLEVGLWFRLYRLADGDLAHEFFTRWFHKACGLAKFGAGPLSSLQQHTFTAAAILTKLGQRTDATRQLAAELHNSLERFCVGPVDKAVAEASLLPDGAGFADQLLGETIRADLASSLTWLIEQRTRRQQLEDALALAASGASIPIDWEVFQSPVGRDLHAALGLPEWKKKVKRAPHGTAACAFQYYAFGKGDKSCFDRLRIVRCIHCNKFTLNVTP